MSSDGPGLDILASIENGQAPRRILEFAARGFRPSLPGGARSGRRVDARTGRCRAVAPLRGDVPHVRRVVPSRRGADAGDPAGAARSHRPRTHERRVLEGVLQHRSVANSTLVRLARHIEADLQDVLITNQARLLAAPEIVESLFENPDLSTDIRRRADEFLEEFFLKKEREQGGADSRGGGGRGVRLAGSRRRMRRPRPAGPHPLPRTKRSRGTSSSASPRSPSRSGFVSPSAGPGRSASSSSATPTGSSRRPS